MPMILKISSLRTSVRRNVRMYYNEFSERYTVDTGFSIFETDTVAITDRWVYELGDTVFLPEFDVEIYGPSTKLKVEQDSDRLGLYHLTDAQKELMVRMRGQQVPFRPSA